MDELLDIAIMAVLVGVLAFVAGLLLKARHGVFACVGAGWLGLRIGTWLGGLVRAHDPSTVTVRGTSYPLLFTFAGVLAVLFLERLVRGRMAGK